MPERLDRLLHFVFEDLEMLLFQAVNGSALFVENRDRQLYFEGFNGEDVIVLLLILFLRLSLVLRQQDQ